MPVLLRVSIALSYLFLLAEIILLLAKRSMKRTFAKQKDRGSLAFLWVVITLGLTAGFMLARYNNWHLINYMIASAGIILVISGLAIRWTAILQLKKAFTVDVAIGKDHELKNDGLYSVVRHPSYLGLLLIMTGESLAMNSLVSFFVVFMPICLAIFYRIRVEEKLLEEFFGDKYRNYKHITRRIIPFIY
jgi:protein-S-isoprenylcysteine O-methyltransferase Ste14